METEESTKKFPDFLFVHGGPCMDDYLRPVLDEPLRQLGIRSRFYQQLKAARVSELVDQIQSILESIPSSKVLVIGHSWGGALALEALRQRDLKAVAGLALVSAPISSQVDDEYNK